MLEFVGDTFRLWDEKEYLIEKFIATGTHGTIFKVRALATRQYYALKIQNIPGHPIIGNTYEKITRAFMQEAQWASALQHPHLVQVLGGGRLAEDAIPGSRLKINIGHVLMEWVEGTNLEKYAFKKALSLQHLCEVMLRMIDVLSYLESQGFLYFDIKPSNIMQTKLGHKLIDLTGLLKNPIDRDSPIARTIITSPPELYDFETIEQNTASEVYALGACIMALLLGQAINDAPWMRKMGLPYCHPRNYRYVYLNFLNTQPNAGYFNELITAMLEIRPENRPTFAQIRQSASRILAKTSGPMLKKKIGANRLLHNTKIELRRLRDSVTFSMLVHSMWGGLAAFLIGLALKLSFHPTITFYVGSLACLLIWILGKRIKALP